MWLFHTGFRRYPLGIRLRFGKDCLDSKPKPMYPCYLTRQHIMSPLEDTMNYGGDTTLMSCPKWAHLPDLPHL